MNQLNEGNTNYTVKFIPWIQESPNGLYYFNGFKQANGLPPTVTEIEDNQSLTGQIPVDPQVGNITDLVFGIGCNPNTTAAAAKNVFTAFKAFVEDGLNGLGGDDWSEFAYLHNHLGYSLNDTDQAINTGAFAGNGGNSLWELMSVHKRTSHNVAVLMIALAMAALILEQPLGAPLTEYEPLSLDSLPASYHENPSSFFSPRFAFEWRNHSSHVGPEPTTIFVLSTCRFCHYPGALDRESRILAGFEASPVVLEEQLYGYRVPEPNL